jgi:hypothetical protein
MSIGYCPTTDEAKIKFHHEIGGLPYLTPLRQPSYLAAGRTAGN